MKDNPPLPRWVWPLAMIIVAIVVLNGVVFVVEAVSQTKTHSPAETIALIGSLSLGVLLVSVFWLRRLVSGALSGTKIVRWLIFIPIFAALILGLLAATNYLLTSAPEFQMAQDFLRHNEALQKEYGTIQNIKSEFVGSSFQIMDNERSGSYQFEIKGDHKSGAVRIYWANKNGQFAPKEVDDLTDPENGDPDDRSGLVTIWKK